MDFLGNWKSSLLFLNPFRMWQWKEDSWKRDPNVKRAFSRTEKAHGQMDIIGKPNERMWGPEFVCHVLFNISIGLHAPDRIDFPVAALCTQLLINFHSFLINSRYCCKCPGSGTGISTYWLSDGTRTPRISVSRRSICRNRTTGCCRLSIRSTETPGFTSAKSRPRLTLATLFNWTLSVSKTGIRICIPRHPPPWNTETR